MNTNKLLIAFFSCALMVGCASNQTDDSDQAAAAKAAAEQQAAAEAAAKAKAAAEAKAKAEAMAKLKNVFYFEFDQATLSADTRADLDAQAAFLKGSNSKIRLEGHADERGTRDYNMALGERRANAVANYLIVNGVERYRIEVISYGEERPVASGSNAAAYAKNRRVELK
ncbi:peptidoglycan-associated lipoprotein Pal [Dasania sp. GY-MA-18]|uniref:Peptidoglycan-associated lipoprotein n=1 Tax=Dasania phycosphaerae TaxID=2950436 RepID=A0A9J6RFY7_9GAMM|nr:MULTISPECIES: peptidoglycan-associated lipoprotein Pal [Dasania]MCR8921138.1 peptidoglycan-associated lipoprotein Pal [Dasania sp. GY-MA-18]MCZ0863566.1 peptidoglycan-associated lipoprotein Pal [Dasania phycosphaerae]MCZ0867294.1 peptidoglycan-associated lipoprotein Pal [Dasania phycosphaerae]